MLQKSIMKERKKNSSARNLRGGKNKISTLKSSNFKAYCVKLEKVTLKVLSFVKTISENHACFICSVYNQTIEWFPIPAYECYEDTFRGKPLTSLHDVELFLAYRKQRQTLICNLFGGPVLIDNVYRRNRVERLVENLAITNYFERLELCFNSEEVDILIETKSLKLIINEAERNGKESKVGRFQKTRPVREPRGAVHHPTPVAPLSFMAEYVVYPLSGATYDKPLSRTDTEPKLSIQESDTSSSIDRPDRTNFTFESRLGHGDHAHAYTYLNSRSNICTNVGTQFRSIIQSPAANKRPETNATLGGAAARQDARSEEPDRRVTRDRHPRFREYDERLATYFRHNWDSISKPGPAVLSEWGLFFTGKIDLVRCFSCGIGFKDWIKEDDPLHEHVRFSPDCHFLEELLGHEQLQSILESIQFTNEPQDLSNHQQPQAPAKAISSHTETLIPPKLPFDVYNPQYQTMESRIGSFANRPTHMTQSVSRFAVAGLYYTGSDDLCRCFACDCGLRSWKTEDDPIEQHLRHFPDCQYIQQVLGSNCMATSQKALETVSKTPAASQPEVNTLTKQMNGISMNGSHVSGGGASLPQGPASRGRAWILRTPAARAVLEMGYSREVITRTIEKLESQGHVGLWSELAKRMQRDVS